jgi:XTP/dITP diphosphohydrolase
MKPSPDPRRLLVASTNAGKIAEIRNMLEGSGWTIAGVPPGQPEPEETGRTFEENAVLKAVEYDRRWGGPATWTLADDSGLEVDALEGRPGVHSSRYAPTDPERIARLLAELSHTGDEQRTARFVCALALVHQTQVVWQGRATVEGRIAHAPSGQNGFGYDPVFYLPDLDRTMAELDPESKNRISHRGRALAQLLEGLKSEILHSQG